MMIRLKGKKQIEDLFKKGTPIRRKWLGIRFLKVDKKCFNNENIKIAIGVSVPKKTIVKAVYRNRMKRRMRTAFQKQQTHFFVKDKNERFLMMIGYHNKKIMPYKKIEAELKTIAKIFKKINYNCTHF